MKLPLIALSVALGASVAQAQSPLAGQLTSANTLGARATQPRIASQPAPAPLVGGSDSCSTPDVITGTGSFAFDNTTATTGAEGQSTVNCIEFNQITIPNDVWFAWTAPQTGRVRLTSCGSTIDTKIGVYAGTVCPGAGATAVACDDDFSPDSFQSMLFFDVTAGQQFLIQVGLSPAPPPATAGMGNMVIEYLTDTCMYDGGITEDAIGLVNGGELGWLHRMGSIGTNTTVSAVSTAWGTPAAAGNIPAGQAASVHVWDDPNDDGDPNDAVLVATATTTVMNPGTDMLQTVNLTTPVTVSGVFFVGAVTATAAGQFALPLDGDSCGYRPGVAWIVGAPGATVDSSNLAANGIPPTTMDSVLINGVPQISVHLLQATCGTAMTGTPFCAGDGTGTACPCGNNSPGGSDAGCLSSLGVGGKLRATGFASLAADTVVLDGADLPNSSALYFQGTTQQNGGMGTAFGDGLRCAGGAIARLATVTNVGGMSQYPTGAQPSVSVKGGIAAPGIRTYQIWYRNAAAFCTASTFNLSNGLQLTWVP